MPGAGEAWGLARAAGAAGSAVSRTLFRKLREDLRTWRFLLAKCGDGTGPEEGLC